MLYALCIVGNLYSSISTIIAQYNTHYEDTSLLKNTQHCTLCFSLSIMITVHSQYQNNMKNIYVQTNNFTTSNTYSTETSYPLCRWDFLYVSNWCDENSTPKRQFQTFNAQHNPQVTLTINAVQYPVIENSQC